MSTTWQADLPGGTWLIGARTSQVTLGGFGDMLTRQVLQLALGAEASGLNEIRAGGEAFRQKYMVWAQNPAEVEKMLTPALESSLLSWKGQSPLIKHNSGGLTIELRGVRLKKAADFLALVRLGELFI
jgi:hypothetical protein